MWSECSCVMRMPVKRLSGARRNGGEALADLAAAKSGVNQQARFRRFQLSAITSRATAQNR